MTTWNPDWTLAPGEILQEQMDDLGINVHLLVTAAGYPRKHPKRQRALTMIEGVLYRKRRITPRIAAILERGTHVPDRFWLALDHNYRHGLSLGRKDVSDTPKPSA